MIRTLCSFCFLLACLTITFAVPQRAVIDFDGDNKTDYGTIRNIGETRTWYLQCSTDGFGVQPWGVVGDAMVSGDYDGDGKWDIAVWRQGEPGTFYILQSQTGTLRVVILGTTGDSAYASQDFDGDGKADPTVTRISHGFTWWYIQRSTLGLIGFQFGTGDDRATRGDFDGDGKADPAVYRPDFDTGAGTFFVLRSSDGAVQSAAFGRFFQDLVFPADFDGDGKTDYALWRAAGTGTGTWHWRQSSDGSNHSLPFGVTLGVDYPVPGDYDGDGKTDQAVWRVGTPSIFYVNGSTAGFSGLSFGTNGDGLPAWAIQVR
jgi:hypothetical protein